MEFIVNRDTSFYARCEDCCGREFYDLADWQWHREIHTIKAILIRNGFDGMVTVAADTLAADSTATVYHSGNGRDVVTGDDGARLAAAARFDGGATRRLVVNRDGVS